MIVLDTNVLSELLRRQPEPVVVDWVGAQPRASLFITAVTQAEIVYGLALLPDGGRRTALLQAADDMFAQDFSGRILPFDTEASRTYAKIAAGRRMAGRPISQFDAQIAAITQSRGGRIATRNVGDFVDCGIEIINPWDAE